MNSLQIFKFCTMFACVCIAPTLCLLSKIGIVQSLHILSVSACAVSTEAEGLAAMPQVPPPPKIRENPAQAKEQREEKQKKRKELRKKKKKKKKRPRASPPQQNGAPQKPDAESADDVEIE